LSSRLNPRPQPRLLFITPAAFNRTTGGGVTFGNLFSGWPKDRLATAHSDPVPTTDETCEKYYHLGADELRRWGPLERMAPAAPGAAATAAPAPRSRLRRMARIAIFGQQLPDSGTLSASLERWIEYFRPEVLYSILGTNGMMQLVLAVQRRFRLPLVVHFMDDWPEASYRGGLISPFERQRMQRLLRETLERATLRLGICEAMCEAYSARYGVPFQAFHNAVDVARWSGVAVERRPKEVVYIGSIFAAAQLESLVDCCQAAARLRDEGVRLSIYSPAMYAEAHRRRLVVADNIALHDTISDDAAFFRRIASADVLLLPVNFDAATVRYIRYSMPTKLPAYLFSGTPILAYGPAEVAQVSYLVKEDAALVVRERGVERVAENLRRLLGDEDLRARLGSNARRLALERHDLRAVRPRFQQALAGAVESARLSGARGPES
jgi:glycosyltransferase involved in cell wall biosynthesis